MYFFFVPLLYSFRTIVVVTMVISVMNACSAGNVVLNQSNLESTMHWRQSPQQASPENDFLALSNRNQPRSSPIQVREQKIERISLLYCIENNFFFCLSNIKSTEMYKRSTIYSSYESKGLNKN